MAGNDPIELSLPRCAEAPAQLWASIATLQPVQAASDEDRFRVELVLTEVLTNILRHSGGAEPIQVRARGLDHRLQVLIVSDGVAFDMSRADAQLPAELLAEGGRGLFLIRECSSAMRYRRQRGWNLHRLSFAIGEPARSGNPA
jgi:anti-sigma regulatory factor (Ser/Thr protein kinase)